MARHARRWLRPGGRRTLAEKLGAVPPGARGRHRRRVWLHAVSLGEMRAMRPVVDDLLTRLPQIGVYLTCSTDTGYAAACHLRDTHPARARLVVAHLPWDCVWCVRRALRAVAPVLFATFEAEIWPEMLYQCEQQGIATALINGRISQRSARWYGRFAGLVVPRLNAMQVLSLRHREDAARLRQLGVQDTRMQVVGDVRSDMRIAATERALGRELGVALRGGADARAVVLFASSHGAEHEGLATLWAQHRAHAAGDALIWAPRHPECFEQVWALCQAQGWRTARYSDWRDAGAGVADCDVLLVDRLGVLVQAYVASDLAIVCGSFYAGGGGHNVLEAAMVATPCVVGPHHANFQQVVATLVAAGAVCAVPSLPVAGKKMRAWLADRATLRARGEQGARHVEAQAGASAATVDALVLACVL